MSKERLFEDFPPVTSDEWRAVVERDLKGADYDKRLVWHTHAGVKLHPYYRREDLAQLDYLKMQSPGSFPFVRGKKVDDNRWLVCQPVTRRSVADANAAAVKAASKGAEAISFRSAVCADKLYDQRVLNLSDFTALLAGLDLSQVQIHFDWGPATPQAAAYLTSYCKSDLAPSTPTGSIEFDPLGAMASSGQLPASRDAYWDAIAAYLEDVRSHLPNMRHVVLHTNIYLDAGSNLAQDLALIISEATEVLAALTDRGLKASDVLRLMGVKASVSSSYFMEIAFFRALRLLWSQMAEAFGVSGDAAQLWVHAETCAVNKTVYDPHINILRQTTETMSAVIGGVDVMSVRPWDDVCGTATEASERLARNTQLVVREESGLDHAVDPAAGSYYLEVLTDGLASRAWQLFQQLESDGGFIEALEKGTVASWIAESRAALDKGVASRRTPLLGTNQFPNADEKMAPKLDIDEGLKLEPTQLTAPAKAFSDMLSGVEQGLPFGDPFLGDAKQAPAIPHMQRLARVFEDLRLRVEALDTQPAVYLWTFGNLAFRKARAGFCYNLYACAGFKLAEGRGNTDVDENLKAAQEIGAKWIVFCSSDEEYGEQVPDLVKATKEGLGDVMAVVAGYPKESVDALTKAGVDDFVHLKTDAVSYLTKCVQIAGGEK